MKTKEIISYLGGLMALTGIASLFIAIWADGWDIVRFAVTGLLLTVWGRRIIHYEDKEEE